MTRVPTTITRDIDHVIHARVEAMSRSEWARKTAAEKLPFVTISREYGCEGYPVAQALEKILNATSGQHFPWMTFDKQILSRISEESGEYPGLVKLVTDEHLSMIGQVFIGLFSRLPNEYEIYQKMAKAMYVLASKGHAIIIGRASAFITKDINRGLHIRLVAPLEYRIDRIARLQSLSRSEAEKQVKKMEEEREGFVQQFTMRQASDPSLYHLIFNNAKCQADEIAQVATGFLRARGWVS